MIILIATLLGLLPLYIDREAEPTPEEYGEHAPRGLGWIEKIPVPPDER